jgi:competence protein ComEA
VLKRHAALRTVGCVIDRRRLEMAGYALAAFAVVFLALRLTQHSSTSAGGGGGVAVSAPAGPPGPSPGRGASAPGAAGLLVVAVAGEVRRPGVYRLPAGSRGEAAVARAGGLTPRADLAAVNLAARVQDGQQVVVPRRGAAAAAAGGGGAGGGGAAAAGAAPGAPISLSSATVEQLDGLDGIGPTLAQRIVAYRSAHGGFRSIDELRQVDGIGDKRFLALKKSLQP